MTRRQAAILLATASLSASAPATAYDTPGSQGPARTKLSATVAVTPSTAGTKRHPRGVAIRARSEIATDPGLDPPIITGIELKLGRGLSWNGSKHATCSKQVLDRHGPKACPRESIVGRVISTSLAGAVPTKPDSTLVNGGEERMFLYTKLDYPARVRKTIPLETSDLSGRWSYKGILRVPSSLQVVAGIPLQTTHMDVEIGGKPYAPDYITSTECPKGGWRYQAAIHYRYDGSNLTGQDIVDGTIPCTS